MEEDKKNIIQLKMTNVEEFIFFKSPQLALWFSGIVFIFLSISGINTGIDAKDIFNFLGAIVIFSIFPCILFLGIFTKVRRARIASTLFIDKENKEFRAYIYDSKKEVVFRSEDIKEIGREPNMRRFYLKDGTWISWAKDEASLLSLDEVIKSFGILIISKKIW